MSELNLDSFLQTIDEMLEKSDVQMLLRMPEGTEDVVLEDNIGGGPVMQFFILMKGMSTAFMAFSEMIDKRKTGECLDSICELLKEDILERMEENKNVKEES